MCEQLQGKAAGSLELQIKLTCIWDSRTHKPIAVASKRLRYDSAKGVHSTLETARLDSQRESRDLPGS